MIHVFDASGAEFSYDSHNEDLRFIAVRNQSNHKRHTKCPSTLSTTLSSESIIYTIVLLFFDSLPIGLDPPLMRIRA